MDEHNVYTFKHRQQEIRARAEEEKARLIASYRERHPEVGWYVTDATVLALASIEAIGRRSEPLREG